MVIKTQVSMIVIMVIVIMSVVVMAVVNRVEL